MKVSMSLWHGIFIILSASAVVHGEVLNSEEGPIGVTSALKTTNLATRKLTKLADQTVSPTSPSRRKLEESSTDGTNCLNHDQSDYRGTISVTKSGRPCQKWEVQFPHIHNRTPQNFPDAGLASNYCRNPDNGPKAWCYTTDPFRRWEFCDVPKCPNESPAPEHSPSQSTELTFGPTVEPSAGPTGVLTETPTLSPSHLPMATPTVEPSAEPTVVLTETPTLSPSHLPVAAPTVEPSAGPTDVPTGTPTVSPSRLPTDMPTTSTIDELPPTLQPTELGLTPAPTMKVADRRTQVPSTLKITRSPTAQKEKMPSPSPTQADSTSILADETIGRPTRVPIEPEPTEMPTSVPEKSKPTVKPSSKPLSSDSSGKIDATNATQAMVREGLSMHLHGVVSLGVDAKSSFEFLYAKHVEDFYQKKGVEVDISINITKVHLPAIPGRRRLGLGVRALTSKGIKIRFTQKSRFQPSEPLPEDSMDDFIEQPFVLRSDRNKFASELQEANDDFSSLTSVSPIELPTTEAAASNAGNEPEAEPRSSNKVAIISTLAVTMVGVSALLVAGFYVYLKRKDARASRSFKTDPVGSKVDSDLAKDNSQLDISIRSELDEVASSAPSQWQLSVVEGGDGISTVASSPTEAQNGTPIHTLSPSQFMVDDQSYLTEEEFDYPNPYISNTSLLMGNRPASSMDDDTATYSEDGYVQGRGYPASPVTSKEYEVSIEAPPGRLGILIHAEMNNGPPIIHSVKETSPLLGKVYVGDRLVAVDEQDVTYMNAIQATKVIADRSKQRRLLHIQRTRS